MTQRDRRRVGGIGGATTSSLSAEPCPATAPFTWFGEYSTTSQPRPAASAKTSPLAWPTEMAVRTLT